MKKLLSLALALLMGTTLLTACNNSGGSEGDKTLTVYTPHPKQVVDDGVAKFEEATGIKVNVVAAGTGELLKRIQSEADNPQCDVFWGGGADSVNNYKEYLDKFVPDDDALINKNFRDPDYLWIGESPLPMVIMYNTKMIPEDKAPKAWKDILDPAYKGKIAMADPAKSGSAFTIMATMLSAYGNGEEGWKFLKDFYENLDKKILSSSSGVYKGVADGEYAMGLTLEKEALRFVKAGSDVKIVYPEEGTSAVPDAIALVKGAKNVEAAKKFLNFVLSKDIQTYMFENYNRRPVRTDIPDVEGTVPFSEIKLVNYDLEWGSANKAELLDNWKKILTGQL